MIGIVFCNLKIIPNIPIHSIEHNSSTSKKNIACTVQEDNPHFRCRRRVNFGSLPQFNVCTSHIYRTWEF